VRIAAVRGWEKEKIKWLSGRKYGSKEGINFLGKIYNY
jgi:hypothetical protein